MSLSNWRSAHTLAFACCRSRSDKWNDFGNAWLFSFHTSVDVTNARWPAVARRE
jgi:hypothetical protein